MPKESFEKPKKEEKMKEKEEKIKKSEEKEKEFKPLNPENWEILTRYEQEYRKLVQWLKSEIKELKERLNKEEIDKTDADGHLVSYTRQLAEAELQLVQIRQMMRAETGNPKINFEQIEK